MQSKLKTTKVVCPSTMIRRPFGSFLPRILGVSCFHYHDKIFELKDKVGTISRSRALREEVLVNLKPPSFIWLIG